MSPNVVRETVRQTLVEHAAVIDSAELARRAIEAMTAEQREAALDYLMPRLVREIRRKVAPVTSWADATQEVVRVAGADKRLGDCTEPEVTALADVRDKAAQAFAGRAEHFRSIGRAMREGHYRLVRDIPEHVGEAILLTPKAVLDAERVAREAALMADRTEQLLAALRADGSSPLLAHANNRLAHARQRREKAAQRLAALRGHVGELLDGILPPWQTTAAWQRLKEVYRDAR